MLISRIIIAMAIRAFCCISVICPWLRYCRFCMMNRE